MIIGFTVEFCLICGIRTEHRLIEEKQKFRKECINCSNRKDLEKDEW